MSSTSLAESENAILFWSTGAGKDGIVSHFLVQGVNLVTELLDMLAGAEGDFERSLEERAITDGAVEAAAGTGNLAEGRSTPGDGTGNPGVNCTCCCN